MSPINSLTLVSHQCHIDIFRLSVPFYTLAYSRFSHLWNGPDVVLPLCPLGGLLQRKLCHRSILRLRLCIGGLLEFFVYRLPFKSYSSVSIRQELGHSGSIIWGLRGFWPRNVISYPRDLRKALPYRKPLCLSHRACKWVSHLVCRGLQEKK
jgi:hypothetical protein